MAFTDTAPSAPRIDPVTEADERVVDLASAVALGERVRVVVTRRRGERRHDRAASWPVWRISSGYSALAAYVVPEALRGLNLSPGAARLAATPWE